MMTTTARRIQACTATDSFRYLVLCFEARRLKPVCVGAVILCRLCGRTLDMLLHRYRLATVWHWSCDFCYCLRRFTPARLWVFFFFFFPLELWSSRSVALTTLLHLGFFFSYFFYQVARLFHVRRWHLRLAEYLKGNVGCSHISELEMRDYLRVILFRKCAIFFFADAAIRHKFRK